MPDHRAGCTTSGCCQIQGRWPEFVDLASTRAPDQGDVLGSLTCWGDSVRVAPVVAAAAAVANLLLLGLLHVLPSEVDPLTRQ